MLPNRSLLLRFLIASSALLFFSSCSPEAKKTRHIERGDEFFRADSLERAEIEYLNAVRIDSQDSHALGQLGKIYLAQGRLLRALEFLRHATQLAPDNTELRVKLGTTFLALGQPQVAHSLARSVLEQEPEDDDAVLLLTESSVIPAQAEEVRELLGKISSDPDQRVAIQLALGLIRLREGEAQAALEHFQHALELDPESATAYSAMGAYYLILEDTQLADESMKRASDLAPPRSPLRLQYARFKLQSGDVQSAKKLLEKITDATPDFVPAWMTLSEIAFGEERYDDCKALLQRALNREPAYPDALILNGRLLAKMGDYDKAAAPLNRLLELFPRSVATLNLLARVEIARGNPAAAIELLQRAIGADADSSEAILLLAQLNLDRGDYQRTIDGLRDYLSKSPRDARAQMILAQAYVQQGRPVDALKIYRELAELLPDNPQFPYLAGTMLLEQDRTEEARQAFAESLSRSAGYLPSVEELISLDLERGDAAAAREKLASLTSTQADGPEFHFLSARILISEGKKGPAEEELAAAVRQQPEFLPGQLLLAQLHAESGREHDALARLRDVLKSNPRDLQVLKLMATIYDELDDHEAARDTYETLLEINPDDTSATNNLAYLYSEFLKQPDRALELAQQARKRQPENPHVADTLGWILVKRGELAWAVSLLEESQISLSSSAEVEYHLGVAYYLLGAESDAEAALRRAINLDSDFSAANDARQRLHFLEITPETAGAVQREELDAWITQYPDDTIALLRLAAIQEHGGNFAQALETYQTLLAARPENIRALVAAATIQAWNIRNIEAGLLLAQKASELAPGDANVTAILGRIRLESGDHARAAFRLREAVQQGARSAEVFYALAWAEFGTGRLNEAQSAMATALGGSLPSTRLDDARQFLNILQLSSDAAEPEAARADAEAILQDRPDYGPACWVRALASRKLGDNTAAVDALRKLLRLYPDFVIAKINLADLLAEDPERLAEASDLANAARNALPNDPNVARILGRIEYLQGNLRRAITLFEESRAKLPDSAECLYYLGMAKYQQDERQEGAALLRQALVLGLPSKSASEVRAILEEAPEP